MMVGSTANCPEMGFEEVGNWYSEVGQRVQSLPIMRALGDRGTLFRKLEQTQKDVLAEQNKCIILARTRECLSCISDRFLGSSFPPDLYIFPAFARSGSSVSTPSRR